MSATPGLDGHSVHIYGPVHTIKGTGSFSILEAASKVRKSCKDITAQSIKQLKINCCNNTSLLEKYF